MRSWVPQLECKTLEDVMIILKYSNRLSDQYETLLKQDSELDPMNVKKGKVCLTFKKYYDLKLSHEFRVLIVDKMIKGITQRNIQVYYPFLEKEKNTFEEIIRQFVTSIVNNIPLKECTCDKSHNKKIY